MTKIRRYYALGYSYFITVVTYKRQHLLTDNFEMFWNSVQMVKDVIKFDIMAWVVLPEHFHMLIHPEEKDPSEIMKRIKQSFAMKYLISKNLASGQIWQHRFWDHIIRDERDFEAHFHYIHYNPTKHGYTRRPYDWQHSSMHEFMDIYDPDWALKEDAYDNIDFGE